MDIRKVKLVYFSATGTTQQVLSSIAKGMKYDEVEHINLTVPDQIPTKKEFLSNELVIMGAPVYGGRLPADAIKRFKQFRGNKTFVVVVVVYGNRDYEDALLELKNLSLELSFVPVAGAAFIGEHSFATKDFPIANGRPNAMDSQVAMEFGAKVKDKIISTKSPGDLVDLKVSGRFPYIAGGARAMAIAPASIEEICTTCGICSTVCPTKAISIDTTVTTENERCIRCCACIKSCPADARLFEDSTMKNIAQCLSQYFSYPNEPRVFGVHM